VSKIISKCCELVKLCHINCSGPVFLRHTVVQFEQYVALWYVVSTEWWNWSSQIIEHSTEMLTHTDLVTLTFNIWS